MCHPLVGTAEPLANPGFESGLASWNIPDALAAQIGISHDAPHRGANSARLEVAPGAPEPYLFLEVEGLEASATYRWSAFARAAVAENATVAGVKIEFYNAQGENTSEWSFRQPRAESADWTAMSVEAQADPDTVRAQLLLIAFEGPVWFDDVEFEKVRPAPELRIFTPTRVAANATSSLPVQFTVVTRTPRQIAPTLSLALRNSEKRLSLISATARIDATSFSLTTRLPPLASGHYAVDLSDTANLSQSAAEVFVTPVPRRPQTLRADDTLLWRGKPFFPIGIYHVNHTGAEYALLRENGFNAIQGHFTTDLTSFRKSLNLALRHKLAVVAPLHAGNQVKKNLAASLAKIRANASHPAILSWKIFDEPDAEANAHLRDEVAKAYLAIKRLKPPQPVELTLSQEEPLNFWKHFCDLVQIDRYPVPGRPLTEVSEFCAAARGAKRTWQNLSVVVQCGWTPDLRTQPAFDQARCMVYLALINGAKGIFWYALRDPAWDLTTTPLWPRMKEINAEIAALAPALLADRDVPGFGCSAADVQFVAKRYARRIYLLATNPASIQEDVTFRLPSGLAVRAARLLATGQPLPLQDGALQLVLGAADSATIVFDL